MNKDEEGDVEEVLLEEFDAWETKKRWAGN